MSVHIFLSTTLRRYISDYDPEKGIEFQLEEKVTVEALLQHLKIPADKVKIIMIDGTNQSLNYLLNGNERIGLFPPVGGG